MGENLNIINQWGEPNFEISVGEAKGEGDMIFDLNLVAAEIFEETANDSEQVKSDWSITTVQYTKWINSALNIVFEFET